MSIALSLLPVEIGRAVNKELEKAAKDDEFFESLIKRISRSGVIADEPATGSLADLLSKKNTKGDSDSSEEYPSPWVSMVHSDP